MRIRALILAFAALGGGPAGAEQTTPPGGLTCKVSGYDVILLNGGTEPIAEGTQVDWSVPFARKEGTHSLSKALEPGGTLFLSGALGSSYLDIAKPCIAALGQAEEEQVQ